MQRIGCAFGLIVFFALGANGSGDSVATDSLAAAPWLFSTIDTTNDVGQHVSLAFDPATDTPYISYYDATYEDLRMARFAGSGGNCGPANDWACETVDSVGKVGRYSSIAVDPTDNQPIIAYFDATNGALKLAIGSVVGWNIKTVHNPSIVIAGQYASLRLDSSGKTHIAYYYSSITGIDSLWYAQYVGGGAGNCTDDDYQCDLVDSGDQVGKYASLALDSSNRPSIAYYDGGNGALKYAFTDLGGWFHREILPTESGQYASLYVDTNNGNAAHIAHYDAANGVLEYAVYVGSGGNCGFNHSATTFEWQCDEIDVVGTGAHPRGLSVAVDAASFPVIGYQSGGSVLKLARPAAAVGQFFGNCGPATPFFDWQCDSLSLGVSISQGNYLSLAVNSGGLATLAYYGESVVSDGDLKIAYQTTSIFADGFESGP